MDTTREPPREKKCITWKKKTKLERFLISISLLLLVAFVVMIGLVLHLETVHKKDKKETICEGSTCKFSAHKAYKISEKDAICESPTCKFRAGTILKNMDLTANPCEDFYQFSCGSYIKYENIYDESINNMNKLDNYNLYLAKQELEKPGYADDPSFVTKIRELYKSCLDESDLKQVVEDFLNVTRLDGWPLSDSSNSSSIMEDGLALAIIFKPIGVLFEIYYKENILNIQKGWVQSEVKYLKMMKYLFTELDISEKDSNKYIDEIEKVQTSLEGLEEGRNDNATIVTVSQLDSDCPQFKWSSMFRYLYTYLGRPGEYDENLKLKIVSMEYIHSLCQIIEKTNKRVMYNLIVWNMILPYLTRFDHILKVLENPRHSLSTDNLKWKTCIKDMKGYTRKSLDYMMIKSLQPEKKIKEVKMYVEQISEILYDVLSNQEWVDDFSKSMMKEKLKNTTFHIGYSEISVNEEIFSQFFDDINIVDSYMKNIILIQKRTIAIEFFNEFKHFQELVKNDIITEPFTFLANYNEENKQAGRIAIAVGTMTFPFYIYGSPQYLNYGSIGIIIGHEFTHAFDRLDVEKMTFEDFDLPKQNEDKFKIDWPQEFLSKYKTRKMCFAKQLHDGPMEDRFMYFIMMKIGENLADNAGMALAYRAYEKYIKQHGEQPTLPGINFTDKQLFFIGYTQGWCHFDSSQPDGVNKELRLRAINPLINSFEFSEAFQCPLNSSMNPDQKCKLWD